MAQRMQRPKHTGDLENMSLVVWLPAMFFLGLGSMALFYAFIAACEKI
jgi:hypothetical protein